ncbi:MAG TPA: ATP-binding cassette domain-containing protein [Miltoncostaeaceae bacterium]|nr:ATP-binding cassette domain-containing protein [Miltoncostaeaceae bacterium]
MLAGERAPDEGRLVRGQTVRLAHLSQEMVELPDDLRVLEAVEQVRRRTRLGDGRELTAGMMCERFGFGGPRGRQPVGDLSGGERRRLQLMRLLMDEPNVLLLDEPTNDLDIDTLTALEDLLDAWPGTLVAVSHDRYFVERVCDNVYALPGDGSIRHLPGGIDEYLRLRRRGTAPPAPTPTRATAAAAPSESPGLSGAERRAAQKEAASIERRLDRLSGEIQGLHQRMADHDQSDYVGLQELTEELRRFEGETAVLEERWMELSELVG